MRDFFPKLHDYMILFFFFKAHRYWVSLQVTWKMTSWSWPSTLLLTILHQFERRWGLKIGWGRGKEAWEYEIKAGTLKEKMLFLCGFESLFLKGSPPHLLWGLAYGVWYRWMHSNTAVKYLALLLCLCSLPAGQQRPGLVEWADSSQLLCKRK